MLLTSLRARRASMCWWTTTHTLATPGQGFHVPIDYLFNAADISEHVQGFYVLVDYHAYPGDTTVASGNLLGDWQTLWTAISGLPTFATDLAGRVFLDLINEPDGINVR